MFKRIPVDKTRGRRRVALRSGKMALALALLIAGSAGVAAAELTFDLKIEGGRLPDTMQRIRVTQGDVVKLRWTSDRPIVLHLHGYDIEKRVVPGTVTELAFTADATGRFPVHIHEQGAGAGGHAHEDLPLAVVEVYPR
jgi:heme/copper-type cytochrome/quinol oxidase subunit 2